MTVYFTQQELQQIKAWHDNGVALGNRSNKRGRV